MSFDESAPRHGHRTPAELAEDEFIEALRGDASRIRFVQRLGPDRHEVVTLHSSRLFPARMADCAPLTANGPKPSISDIHRPAQGPESQ